MVSSWPKSVPVSAQLQVLRKLKDGEITPKGFQSWCETEKLVSKIYLAIKKALGMKSVEDCLEAYPQLNDPNEIMRFFFLFFPFSFY